MTPKPQAAAMGGGGDATGVPSTALVVPRDDTAYVEWSASVRNQVSSALQFVVLAYELFSLARNRSTT